MNSNCLLATIYHRFGIKTSSTLTDRSGRPMYLLDRFEPIREVI